jgi:hypothetical protein
MAAELGVKRKDHADDRDKTKKQKTTPVASAPFPSPIERCDDDSLTVVLSLLNLHQLVLAMRLSRRWHYLSQRHTAWPKLQFRHLIARLETNTYEHKTKLTRRLAVTPVNLAWLAASPTWNKVVDITLQATSEQEESFDTPALATAFLDQVATGLRHVESMQLDADVSVLCQANLLFESCKERLRALVFNPPLLNGHRGESLSASQPMPALAQLTNLRVLMLSLMPHCPSVASLVHLEYLHIVVVAVHDDPISAWTDEMATTLLALRATLVSLSVQLSSVKN